MILGNRVKPPATLLLALLVLLAPAMRADQARDDRWRADLDYLASELPKRHANLFYLMSRQQFDQAVSSLREAIPNLSDTEIIVGMARVVAMAGDAHTTISLPSTYFNPLPLVLYWFEDGLYVIGAAPEYRRALTARVVQIGDQSAEEAFQAVSSVIPHENDWWVRQKSPAYFIMPELLAALKISPGGSSVRFTFEDSARRRFVLDVEPRPGVQLAAAPDPLGGFLPVYLNSQERAYWFVYLETSRTLYFKYNMCRDMADLPFSGFAAQLFSVFDSQPVDRLVVDLRNNPGGSSIVLDPFFAGLRARKARFSSATRLYVLMGRGTFSSAMLNANVFTYANLGIAPVKMGEPTGGNPTVPWRNGASLTLPNSGLVVSYTTTFVNIPYTPEGAVMPDVPVRYYSSDWFARHDPVLAAALADSDAGPAPAATSGLAVVNGASFQPGAAVAAGSLASAFGDFTGADSGDAGGVPLPTQLGGTQVLVDDVAAPLVAVRPAQINFQIPAATPVGKANVRVVRGTSVIASGTVDVAETGPGLFVVDALNAAQPGAILNEDYRLNAENARARAGEVVQIFGTGQGPTSPAVPDGAAGPIDPLAQTVNPPTVYIGVRAARVLFSGMSAQFPGLWQINVQVPAVPAIAGQSPLFVVSGRTVSNPVTLWVEVPR